MNKLLIPPSPNWYETDIIACAPDNTIIYGSRQDIIVIKTTPENEPDDVQVLTKAHSMRIKSVNTNRNWGQPHKYAVTVSEDKVVKLWDIESLEKKSSHNKHILQDDDTKIVGASFAGDDRVISTSESGTVIIWNITKNETNIVRSLFDVRTTVTCLSVCPHATWLAAFGLKSGLIAVADLRKTGKILYKLRGHDKAVVSLSWCPTPINIFPVKPNNKVVEKLLEDINESVIVDKENVLDAFANNEPLQKDKNDDGKEIISSPIKESLDNIKEETTECINESLKNTREEKTDRRKQKHPKKAPNPWVGLIHADDDTSEIVIEPTEESDFLKECANLRKDILQMSTPKSENKVEEATNTQESTSAIKVALRTILKPRTKSKLSEVLLKKGPALECRPETLQNDLAETEASEKEKVDTPTDRREISMEISWSVEKLNAKLTDINEKSMKTAACERNESTNSIDTVVSEVNKKDVAVAEDCKESSSDTSKLDTTTSSEEGKQFSSVSSCDNDCNCKKHTGKPKKEEIKKNDTSSASESEVFHDAQVCEKGDKERVICIAEDSVNSEEQPRKEFLLASSARDPNIYIWRAGTDGRMQCFMTVPSVKTQKKSRPEKMWITICWVAPNILLSSSRSAELLQWTLPKPMVQAKSVRQVHKDHWSVLFSIKAPMLYLNEYNFLQKRDINAWTTGMDRTILNTDIGSLNNLSCYHALGGSVNCFSGSPLDPNRLAFGTGEGVLNVWDLSREHKKRIVFSTFYQKILASVTALAWHPLIETSLAFGTIEGRIGILDTVAKAKSPKLLTNYFKNQIFKIEWGPFNGNMKNPALFVVGEAQVAIFNSKYPEEEPHLLEMPDNTSVYTMSWKPDFSVLLVSSKSGSLITYTADLKISNISYLRHKLQSIVWNPNAASDDLSVSKYCRTFASVVKHSEFVVYDLAIQGDLNDDKVIAHFENRAALINSIEWNPHSGNQLVFIDDGGIAQVYDIETKTVLSTYVNPCLDSLLSVYWSPVDPDYIISGTVGHKIIVWKVSENGPLTDKEINSTRNRITKAQSKEVGDQLVKTKLEVPLTDETEATKLKQKNTKSSIMPLFYTLRDKAKVQDLQKLLRWKLGDKTVESNIGDNRNIDVLEVFDDKNNMDRVLELNISSFRQKGQHHNGNLLTLFKGDIGTAVKEAIEQKRVTPWIISMCPMVDPKLWQTACETYANQLQEEAEADPLEIVTYLLACHKVEESVNVLCEKAMFREAMVLAKTRFGADNSIVFEIMDKWAKNLVFQGNLEMAAQCYISIGKFEEAASALFRRSNAELLELAVELAKLSGNEELHKAVQFRFNAFKTDIDDSKAPKTTEQTNKEMNRDYSKQVVVEKGGSIETNIGCDVEKVGREKASDWKESLNKDTKKYLEDQVKLMKRIEKIRTGSGSEIEVDNRDERNESDLNEQNFNGIDSNIKNNSGILKNTEKSPIKLQDNEKEPEEHEKLEHKNATSVGNTEEKPVMIRCENAGKEVDDGDKSSSEANSMSEAKDFDKSDASENTEKLKEVLCQVKENMDPLEVVEKELESKSVDSNKAQNGEGEGELENKLNVENCNEDCSKVLKEKVNDLVEDEESTTSPKVRDDIDAAFYEKVKEFLSDSLQEKADKLEEGVQKVLESQKGLLSTEDVKELLAKRKMSVDGDACVKEVETEI